MATAEVRAIGYIRVSTEEQAAEGVSLDAQRSRLKAYCSLREGMILVDVIADEGVSASKPLAQRPGGQQLTTLVEGRKVDAVVAWKLDRLFRDCAECLTVTTRWDRAAVAVHLVDLGGQAVDTRSAIGRFFLTMMAGAAELERNQIRERTRVAMAHKREVLEYTGGYPRWGYAVASDGCRLEVLENEQTILRRVAELRAAGQSFRGIVADLKTEGFRSRVGKPFGLKQVVHMVRTGDISPAKGIPLPQG